MAIVLAPIVVGAAAAGAAAAPTAAATVGGLLVSTALSMSLSFAAGALQPKANTSGGETAGRMVTVSNTGTDPRIVILGRFRDAGTLVWHKEHEGDSKVKVTQVIRLCDMPIQSFQNEIVDGGVIALVPNNSQMVKGHTEDGPGFNFGDTPKPDDLDWMPVVGDGGHGDIWRQTPAAENGPFWKLRGKKWEELPPGTGFHDLPNSNPANSLGANGDVAINRATGEVFIRRGGFWRTKAHTPATAAEGEAQFIESSAEPKDHNRFLHWEDEDRRWRWHFKVRYFDGTQTAADSFLQAIADPPSEWDSTFKGLGGAYKVVTQRYYPDIYTGGFPVHTATIMQGVKVYDPRRPATGTDVNWYGATVKSNQIAWTENAALIAAFIKCWPELPGAVPYDEIDEPELIASANVCAQTITNPDGSTEPRYSVNGMVQSTETRDSVEEALEIALGGHIFRRNGKWVIWAGRARATTASFTERNIIGTDYGYQPGPGLRERKNTVIGTWFAPNHSYTQVSMATHQNPTFLAEDKGQELVESIHFRFASRSRFTPRRQAKIWLNQRRNEHNVLTVNLDVEALDLAPLDVVEITESFIPLIADRFTVVSVESPFLKSVGDTSGQATVSCALTAYNPNTWDAPTEDPTEEDPVLPGVRDLTSVSPPTELEVVKVSPRAALDATGQYLANVVLQVGRSDDLRAEEYEVQYRMSPENFTILSGMWGNGSLYEEERDWTSLLMIPHGNRKRFKVQIKALFDGAFYDFRVRALNSAGAASDAYTDDDWTRQIDAFSIDTGNVALPGPPGSQMQGDTLINNGNFEQKELGWEFQVTGPATITVSPTGGKFGPRNARIDFNGSTATQRIRTNAAGDQGGLLPVERGQRYALRLYAKPIALTADINCLLNLQFYGADGKPTFISTLVANTAALSASHNDTWRRVRGSISVPDDDAISFMRPQPSFQPQGSTTNAVIRIDGLRLARVTGGTSEMLVAAVTLNQNNAGAGDVWTNIRNVTASTPGDPVRIRCEFEARVADAGPAGSPIQLEARVLRFNADMVSNQTTIMSPQVLGDPVPPGTNYGATPESQWGSRRLDVLDNTGDRGTFFYVAQFRTNVNGKAAVRERVMSWNIVDEAA